MAGGRVDGQMVPREWLLAGVVGQGWWLILGRVSFVLGTDQIFDNQPDGAQTGKVGTIFRGFPSGGLVLMD